MSSRSRELGGGVGGGSGLKSSILGNTGPSGGPAKGLAFGILVGKSKSLTQIRVALEGMQLAPGAAT
jgi:hypothetical protein